MKGVFVGEFVETFFSAVDLSFSVIGPGYLCSLNVWKKTAFYSIINYFLVPGLCL